MAPLPRWNKFLSAASRSRSFLAKFAAVIVAAGFALGLIAHYSMRLAPPGFADRALASAGLPIEKDGDTLDERAPTSDDPAIRYVSIVPLVAAEIKSDTELAEVVADVPEFASFVPPTDVEGLRGAFAKRFGDAAADLLVSYVQAWNEPDGQSYKHLETLAGAQPPVRHANFALGRIEWKRKNYATAAHYFEEEGRQPEARGCRHRAVLAWLKARDSAHVAALQRDPRYQDVFTPYVRLKLAAAQHDWPTILREAPRLQWSSYELDAVVVSIIAALGWALFLTHLGQWEKPFAPLAALAAAGLALGILSTFATIYAVIWEEDIFRVTAGNDPLHILLYYVAGVGVREEVCKLLLFLPLLPYLVRRDDELDVLIAASFVGLGFAVEENATYFANSDATSAAGRFLSANFFHIVLTGCNGLALFRALRRGGRGVNEFMWVFPASIVAHGAYDALQSMPTVPEGPYLAMGVFVAGCLLYFRNAEELRTNRRMTLSLSGAFVTAVSLLAAATIAHHLALFGPKAGVIFLLTEIAAAGGMVVVFFRIFNEPLGA